MNIWLQAWVALHPQIPRRRLSSLGGMVQLPCLLMAARKELLGVHSHGSILQVHALHKVLVSGTLISA